MVENSGLGGRSVWRTWVAVVIGAQFALFLWLGLSRHWGGLTSLNDLGVFDQAVWGILQGSPFLNSITLDQPFNLLGVHFSPVLALFAPFYGLKPWVEWFMLAQAMALSLAAWPIFLLASRVLLSERAGFLWALIYLANPFLLNAAAWDFHPVSLSVPFMALGMLAVERRQPRLLVVCCLVLLMVQEQLGLAVAGFGGIWWLRHHDWRLGLALMSMGIAQVALVLSVIMPALSPTHSHPMMSGGLGHLSRYGWIGHSPGEIAANALTRPIWLMGTALWDWGGASYVCLLLLPFLCLAALAPEFLLPGLGDLAANLLSANPMQRSWWAYHSVNLIPLLAIASIYGTKRLCDWRRRLSYAQLASLPVIPTLSLSFLLAPLPLPGAVNFWSPNHDAIAPDPALPAVIQAVPKEASLSVQGNVGANFSQRRQVYFFPAGLPGADNVVLKLESPTSKLYPEQPVYVATLAHHLQLEPAAYLNKVEQLVSEGEYGVLLWQDPWLVLVRGGSPISPTTKSEIVSKLERLRREWLLPEVALSGKENT